MKKNISKIKMYLNVVITFALMVLAVDLKSQVEFSVSADTGCAPMNVQFVADQQVQSYFWDFGDGASSVLATPSHVYLQPGSYTVRLIAVHASGIMDSVIHTACITVLNKPVANFQVINATVCQNSALATFTNNSANAVQYIWDFGDGTTSSTVNPQHMYSNAGNYNVQLIAQNTFGCSDFISVSNAVHVVAQPILNFAATDTILCLPDNSTSFTNLSSSVTSVQWNFGDGTFSTLANPAHIYNTPGNFDIVLIAQNASGCIDTLVKNAYISVIPQSASSIQTSVNSGCVPLAVSFSTAPAVSYFWDFGNGNTSSDPSPSTIFANPGVFDVTVTLIKANGCTEVNYAPALINIPEPAIASYSVTNTSGCAPLVSQFTNLSQNAVSYVWNFGDGHYSSLVNPSNTFNSNGNYSVQLKAYNSAGCMSTFTATTTINSYKPHADFVTSTRISCAPFPVTFNNSSSAGAVTYFWDFGDGSTSTQVNPLHTYNTPGNFTVKLIAYNANGCSDTLIRQNYITVINPTMDFSSPDTLRGCAPFSVSMNDSTFGAASWHWNFGDGAQSTLHNPNHTYTEGGVYTVTLDLGLNGGCTQFYPEFKKVIVEEVNPGFTYNYDCNTHTVTFLDTTSNILSNTWSFSDGTSSNSINPTHTYSSNGLYNISLNVTNTAGCSQLISYINYISVYSCNEGTVSTGTISAAGDNTSHNMENTGNPPGVNNQVRGCAPLTAYFSYPLQTGTPLIWLFGDNTSSTLPNPSHVYNHAGLYTVKLAYQRTNGTIDTLRYTNLISLNKPEADFTANLGSNCVQYFVNTTNYSVNANKYNWDFGDNTTSTAFSPSHTYTTIQNNYSISLLAQDTISGCSSSHATTLFMSNNNLIWADKYETCAGTNLSFYFSSASYVSYSWNFGDGTSAASQNPSHTFAASGTYNVELTVVDNFGCSKVFSLPQPVAVYDPHADFTYIRSGSCSGYQITFNNLGVPSNPGANGFYYWTFGDGTSATQNTSTVVHNYVNPGTYQVTLKIVTNGGCINTITKTIEVNRLDADFAMTQNRKCFPMEVTFHNLTTNALAYSWNFGNGTQSSLESPVITYNEMPLDSVMLIVSDYRGCTDTVRKKNFQFFANEVVLNNDSVCVNSALLFSTALDSVSNYWAFGDGSSSSLTNPSHTYTTGGTFAVSLISTDSKGCVDSSSAFVYAGNSTPAFATIDTTGCAPKLVHFNNLSAGAVSYHWDFGDGSGSTSANPSHIYNTPGMYSVKLISYNTFGCADTLVIPNYIHIIGPVVSFELEQDTVCFSNPVNLQIASSNVATWSWDFGDGASSAVSNPSHLYAQPGHYIISLIAHDQNGCSAYYIDSSLFVSGNPTATISSDITTACTPASVHFQNNSAGGIIYNWNFGNGIISTSAQAPDQVYETAGNYSVELVVKNAAGCSDTASINLTIKKSPVAAFALNAQSVCYGTTVDFINNSSDTIQPSFSWLIQDSVFSNAGSPSVSLTNTGANAITLIVVNGNGCSDTLTYENIITVADTIAPVAPIRLVSVLSDNSITVEWQQADSDDFYAYVLYRKNNQTGMYLPIDTIMEQTVIQFTDNGLNTLQNSYWYKLQAIDKCGNKLSMDELIPSRSIEVRTAVLADNTINVNWNAYAGCSVASYVIERSEANSNQFVEIATVPSGQHNYIDSSAFCPVNFTYRIKGISICGSDLVSMSDTATARPKNLFKDQVVDIIRSTVVDNSTVLTEWAQPQIMSFAVSSYKLFRKENNNSYEFIANLPASQTSYLDSDVDVSKSKYEYKIVPVNYCNLAAGVGQNGISILLDMHQGEKETILRWSTYSEWNTGVDHYIIERLNENGSWEEVKSVDASTTEQVLDQE